MRITLPRRLCLATWLAVAGLLATALTAGCTTHSSNQPDQQSPPTLGALYTMDSKGVQENWKLVQERDKETLRLLGSLTNAADKALLNQVTSVTDKPADKRAPGGDAHDYLSLSDYYWPNPDHPNGPYIRRDGQRNPEIDTIPDRTNIRNMLSDVNVLALAYYLGGNTEYAAKVAKHLKSWFIDASTRMNPNLKYAQMIKQNPDVPEGQGIIDVWNLPVVLDAVRLVSSANVLNAAELQAVSAWFQAYFNWLTTSTQGTKEAAYANNRGTWYRAQLVAIAAYLGNISKAKATADEGRGICDAQIQPDGTQPAELARGISWDYSTFNLYALFRLGMAARAVGVDMFGGNTKLRAAVVYLVPFGLGEQKWTYPQVTPLNPDALRPPLAYAAYAYGDALLVSASQRLKTSAAISLGLPQPKLQPSTTSTATSSASPNR